MNMLDMDKGGIKRAEPLRLQVAERIRQELVVGHHKPGQRFTEKALAEKLSVSRTPAREALSILGESGVLEILPKGGYAVPNFSPADIANIYELREYLEMPALMKVVDNMTEDLARDLSVSLDEMERGVQETSDEIFLGAFLRHRNALFGSCGNRQLSEHIQRLDNYTLSVKNAVLLDPQARKKAVMVYRGILSAAMDKDVHGAVMILRSHHQDGMKAFEKYFAQGV